MAECRDDSGIGKAEVSPASSDNEGPDNFLTHIFECATSDDEVCTCCDEGIPATSRCIECAETLCQCCTNAHHRVTLTKDHTIINLHSSNNSPKMVNPLPMMPSNYVSLLSAAMASMPGMNSASMDSLSSLEIPSTSSSSLQSLAAKFSPRMTPVSFMCEIHEERKMLCDDCIALLCPKCGFYEHATHRVNYMDERQESAVSLNDELFDEARCAMRALTEGIMLVQHMCEQVEMRSHQAVRDVHRMVRHYVCTVEERERDMFQRIERQRAYKNRQLTNQLTTLKSGINRLNHATAILSEGMECQSPIEMMYANRRAEYELRSLRALKDQLQPCEDDIIAFTAPDEQLLKSVSMSGGNMIARLNTRELTPKVKSRSPPADWQTEMGKSALHSLLGRPIFNYDAKVIVKDNGMMPSIMFGSEGPADGFLCRPWGVCCDKFGNIYVADRSNNRIQVFNVDGTFKYKFGEHGHLPGQFERPAGITIDSRDRIIIADKDNHRIQVLSLFGEFILQFGEKGCRPGQFNYPWDVAANSIGHIVVSDTRNHRIQLFNKDGMFLTKYGFENNTASWKIFDSPRSVCFNTQGRVIVSDFNNHRLVIVDQDFKHARFLGGEGGKLTHFNRPQGVICDDEGRVIVADSRNNRIQVFRPNGTFLFSFGRSGTGPGEMDRPSGICLSPQGRIIFVDFGNNRVQIY